MNSRFLNLFLIASMIPLAASPSRADTRWTTFTPKGEGFSIDVPGEPQPNARPGHYVYILGESSLIIQVDPVDPPIREIVQRGEREVSAWYLRTIRDGAVKGGQATLRTSSTADFDGYPSIQFTLDARFEDEELEGSNRFVLTEEHMYMLVTTRLKGSSAADADRFLGSLRLVRTDPVSATARHTSSATGPIVAKMAGPTLAVARLITEEKLSPLIDQIVRRAPAAERLGTRWNASNAAWQQARKSINSRIAQLADLYEQSDEVVRALEAELARLAPGSEADALAAVLNGAAGSEILRQQAFIHFVSTVMADDPHGPRPGERAWAEKLRALTKVFDERVGSTMPRADGAHAAEATQFLSSPASHVSTSLMSSVVGKATSQLEGAINLMLFDCREVIQRDIEAAIARAPTS